MPTKVIELREYGDAVEFVPTTEERRVLARFTDVLAVREIDGTRVELSSNKDSVGGVSLSRNTSIVVRPKIPMASLVQLVMIAYGIEPLRRRQDPTMYARGTVIDWLAITLVLEIQRLISNGLRRGYVRRHEPLGLIRGRIDFRTGMRRPASVETICFYTPFTIDTHENQILVGTLDRMSRYGLLPEIKNLVVETARTFEGVSRREISRFDFDSVSLTRLNQQYESALALCKMFLEGSGLEFGPGSAAGRGFFISMNDTFERAVTNTLRKKIPRLFPQRPVKPLAYVSGEPYIGATMVPDMTIFGSDGKAVLVLDTKYKKPIVPGQFGPTYDNGNIYQIIVYSKALGCGGVLIYPRIDLDVDVTMELQDITFSIITVDLSMNVRASLEQLSQRITQMLEQAYVGPDAKAS